jgi:hypothetical protein
MGHIDRTRFWWIKNLSQLGVEAVLDIASRFVVEYSIPSKREKQKMLSKCNLDGWASKSKWNYFLNPKIRLFHCLRFS